MSKEEVKTSKETATKKDQVIKTLKENVAKLFAFALKTFSAIGDGLKVNETTKYTSFLLEKKIINSIRLTKNGLIVGVHVFNASGSLVKHEHLPVTVGPDAFTNLSAIVKVVESNYNKVISAKKAQSEKKVTPVKSTEKK